MTEPYCSFQVGDKVVYVDDGSPQNLIYGSTKLIPNAIYTVRWVGLYEFDNIAGVFPAIKLIEAVRHPHSNRPRFHDAPYGAHHFRRVISTDEGMAILRKIDADVFQNDSVPA